MSRVINPFAVRLNIAHGGEKYGEVEDLSSCRLVYRQGDYTIWKKGKTFNTCWKNIIITQTVGAPKLQVDALHNGKDLEGSAHYHLQRMKEAINDGVRYAQDNKIELFNL